MKNTEVVEMRFEYEVCKNGEVIERGRIDAEDVVSALYELLYQLPLSVDEVYIDSDPSTRGFAPYCSDGSSWGPWDSSYIVIDGEGVELSASGCSYEGSASFEDLDGNEWSVGVEVAREKN